MSSAGIRVFAEDGSTLFESSYNNLWLLEDQKIPDGEEPAVPIETSKKIAVVLLPEGEPSFGSFFHLYEVQEIDNETVEIDLYYPEKLEEGVKYNEDGAAASRLLVLTDNEERS